MDQLPSTTTSRIKSPKLPQNHSRLLPRQRIASDNLLSDLTPTTTYKSITSPSGQLKASIEAASQNDRAFGIRAAATSKKIQEWIVELSSWSWPKRDGPTGFELSAAGNTKEASPEKEGDSTFQEALNTSFNSISNNQTTRLSSYEARINDIQSELDNLNVDEIKRHVLDTHLAVRSRPSSSCSNARLSSITSISYSNMDDFTAMVTAVVLQTLPNLSKLMQLLDIWGIRIFILQSVPKLMLDFEDAETALKSGWNAIGKPSRIDETGNFRQPLSRETFDLIRCILRDKISKIGKSLDFMLDTLEGRPETLPSSWILRMEILERGYGEWVVAGDRKIIEGEWNKYEISRSIITDREKLEEKKKQIVIAQKEKSFSCHILEAQDGVQNSPHIKISAEVPQPRPTSSTLDPKVAAPSKLTGNEICHETLDTNIVELRETSIGSELCAERDDINLRTSNLIKTLPVRKIGVALDEEKSIPSQQDDMFELAPNIKPSAISEENLRHSLSDQYSSKLDGENSDFKIDLTNNRDVPQLKSNESGTNLKWEHLYQAIAPPAKLSEQVNLHTVTECIPNIVESGVTELSNYCLNYRAKSSKKNNLNITTCSINRISTSNPSTSLPIREKSDEDEAFTKISTSVSSNYCSSTKLAIKANICDDPKLQKSLNTSDFEEVLTNWARLNHKSLESSHNQRHSLITNSATNGMPTGLPLTSASAVFYGAASAEYSLQFPLDGSTCYTYNTLFISSIHSDLDISTVCEISTMDRVLELDRGSPGIYLVKPPQPVISIRYRGGEISLQKCSSNQDVQCPPENLTDEQIALKNSSSEFTISTLTLPEPTNCAINTLVTGKMSPVPEETYLKTPKSTQLDGTCEACDSIDTDTQHNVLNFGKHIFKSSNFLNRTRNPHVSSSNSCQHFTCSEHPISTKSPLNETAKNSEKSQESKNIKDESNFDSDIKSLIITHNEEPSSLYDTSPPNSPLMRAQRPRAVSFGPDRSAAHIISEAPTFVNLDVLTDRATPTRISKLNTDEKIQQQISSLLESIPARILLDTKSNPSGFNSEVLLPRKTRKSTIISSRSTSNLNNASSHTRSSTPSFTLAPAYAKGNSRPRHQNSNSEIRVYHLSRSDGGIPIKLLVRLVGERGERVMVRVGGGWADLGEYLKEYASHHGRRNVTDTIKIHDIPPRAISSGSITSISNIQTTLRSQLQPKPKNFADQLGKGGSNITKSRNLGLKNTSEYSESQISISNIQCPSTPIPSIKHTPWDTPPSVASSSGTIISAVSGRSSRMSWVEEDFNLGLAGPTGKKNTISDQDNEWVESMKEKVRLASAEKDKKNRERVKRGERERSRGLSIGESDKYSSSSVSKKGHSFI
ncbi:unnamed protein product [Blumeria hordei]|uniref:GAR domain-containing protein n=1 Tax=Blumeria hordei TaxID=2867405 RepID=A0A383UUW0_BLUHO|nr:unnamed protein product [Blumeria hordei]